MIHAEPWAVPPKHIVPVRPHLHQEDIETQQPGIGSTVSTQGTSINNLPRETVRALMWAQTHLRGNQQQQ